MDTGSHLLFGATLAGLAMLDPALTQEPELANAVLAGTLIGSHAPDFDTVTRLKGYSCYLKYHRGIAHSLPALLIWPAVISVPLAFAFHVTAFLPHLYFWTMLAVILHVFLDLLNVYGVQCFKPFNRKWHHWDILSLFDPFLFAIHTAGVVLWMTTELAPANIFTVVYAVSFVYIVARGIQHTQLVKRLRSFFGIDGLCHVVPGLHWFRWQFVMETEQHFYTGAIDYSRIVQRDVYRKDHEHPAVKATLATDGVRAFLHFAQRVHVSINERNDGYDVQWRDVRFWYDHKLPFGVDVKLDRNMNVLSHSIGWRKKAWDPPYV